MQKRCSFGRKTVRKVGSKVQLSAIVFSLCDSTRDRCSAAREREKRSRFKAASAGRGSEVMPFFTGQFGVRHIASRPRNRVAWQTKKTRAGEREALANLSGFRLDVGVSGKMEWLGRPKRPGLAVALSGPNCGFIRSGKRNLFR